MLHLTILHHPLAEALHIDTLTDVLSDVEGPVARSEQIVYVLPVI